jgi:anti-anti-sigma regulatory factor
VALDPEIEEAAIRFASGDDVAAEQGLLDILTRRQANGSVDEWMALFDLYRATGQLDAFDGRAIDFANRFSRSAPQWFSMKDEVAARRAKVFQPSADLRRAAWVAESDLDLHSVTLLSRLLERTPQPWVIDWSALKSIQHTALAALTRLFHLWANEPVDLRFVGARQLREVLTAQTRSGDRSVLQSWWTLRLAVLRVMGMGDDFEMAALDFCVTYEVSPPGWESPRCHFKSLQTADEAGVPPALPGKAQRVSFVDSSPSVLASQLLTSPSELAATGSFMIMPQAELMGEILSDAQAALSDVDRQLEDSTVLEVSCKYLIRVDFSAAGGILNWASAHKQRGHEVRFVDVHRLIAAFFHVIGITEYANVTTRAD